MSKSILLGAVAITIVLGWKVNGYAAFAFVCFSVAALMWRIIIYDVNEEGGAMVIVLGLMGWAGWNAAWSLESIMGRNTAAPFPSDWSLVAASVVLGAIMLILFLLSRPDQPMRSKKAA